MLDQLTFGDRVESPTATKLPILLAVALLKDGNGAIRLDLPIQGSLDDPQFSVWGVVVQIIVNLITKAVTAPFALLGALAGSHGEELAFVEFAPGRAELSAPAEAKLQTLAKALADRPALKLDVAGRAVPDVDRDGLKRVALDRAMRAQKQKALVAKGRVRAVARRADDRRRRASGIPGRRLSRHEACRTSRATSSASPRTFRRPRWRRCCSRATPWTTSRCARSPTDRAETVKEWFAGRAGVASERMFIVAPKLNADGIQDKGAPTRVDFAIR